MHLAGSETLRWNEARWPTGSRGSATPSSRSSTADREGISTAAAADRLARARLAAARA